jgi:Holliday junction DNA helicase RuvA
MIARLRGAASKLQPGTLVVDVGGVGYKLSVPLPAWDGVTEGESREFAVSTYVREDRLELYGFLTETDRTLFERLIELPGIGPKMGLELCSVPKSLIEEALMKEDPRLLSTVKGVGRKTAEKLLIELKNLREKDPGILAGSGAGPHRGSYDQDAMAALAQLGYNSADILRALDQLPKDLQTTEERVTAALRSL